MFSLSWDEIAVVEHTIHVVRTAVDRAGPDDPHGIMTHYSLAMETLGHAFLDDCAALETKDWPLEKRRRFWGALARDSGDDKPSE